MTTLEKNAAALGKKLECPTRVEPYRIIGRIATIDGMYFGFTVEGDGRGQLVVEAHIHLHPMIPDYPTLVGPEFDPSAVWGEMRAGMRVMLVESTIDGEWTDATVLRIVYALTGLARRFSETR